MPKTLTINTSYILYAAKILIAFALVRFWQIHQFGTTYAQFFSVYLQWTSSFLASNLFSFFFRAAVYAAITLLTYSVLVTALKLFKAQARHWYFYLYSTLLAVVFFGFGLRTTMQHALDMEWWRWSMMMTVGSVTLAWVIAGVVMYGYRRVFVRF